MKSFGWFVIGVVSGLVAGHKVANSPAGRAFIADLTEIGREFSNGVKEGFSEGTEPTPQSTSSTK